MRTALEEFVPHGVMQGAYVLDLGSVDGLAAATAIQNFTPDAKWSHQNHTVFFSSENDLVRFRLMV